MSGTIINQQAGYLAQPQPKRRQSNNINTNTSSRTTSSSSRKTSNYSFDWDTDPALFSSDSNSDSTLHSPSTPTLYPSYALPKDNLDDKVSDSFNLGTFEDWMRWEDPSDAALSPSPTAPNPYFKLEPESPMMSGLDYTSSNNINTSLQNNNDLNDAAIFGSVQEEPLFQTPNGLITPQERETGLYSTPLSWSRPTLGTSNPLAAAAAAARRNYGYTSTLTPQEELKLRSIAMPDLANNTNTSSSNNATYASPSSSPEPDMRGVNSRKRKSSMSSSEADQDQDLDDDFTDHKSASNARNGNGRPVKKTAHNMIEKRYRTNLNDKIAALRDSVPSLRVMVKKNSRGEEVCEDLQGLTPAHKLNKATVLSKATEYISHLEKRNRFLSKENAALKARVDAFEMLVMARQGGNTPASQRMGAFGGGNMI